MRFSLRTLLIVVSVLGVIAALAGNKYRSRHRAYVIIESHNATIAGDDNEGALNTSIRALLPRELTARVDRFRVQGEPLQGELLWAVRQFREVKEVIIVDTHVRAKDCLAVSQLPNVQDVSLHGCTMEPGCVAALCRNKSLRDLGLAFTNTVDVDCDHIAQCKSITTVNLSGTMVTDSGLEAIAALPSLSFLFVSPDEITPAGIEAVIARHPTLVVQCYGPKRFEDDWASKIEQRYPRCKIHR